jgi:hypothetical protein
MALYVVQNQYTALVAQHLYAITKQDGGLGQGEVYETSIEVTYDKHPATELEYPGISQYVQYIRNRLDDIINMENPDFAQIVNIQAGDPSTVYRRKSLCQSPGTTYNLQPKVAVLIIYDATDCLDAPPSESRWLIGYLGERIPVPPAVILWHELCHAYWILTTGSPQTENEIIAEENALRIVLGLPERNPETHHLGGGCDSCGKKSPSWGLGKLDLCFMISAAYESDTAPEAIYFRYIREKWLGRSSIGYELFRKLTREYGRFAAIVAQRMNVSQPLRQNARLFLVDVILIYFRSLDSLISSGQSGTSAHDVLLQQMSEHRRDLHENGVTDEEITMAAIIIQQVPELLEGRLFLMSSNSDSGSEISQVLRPALDYITSIARRGGKPNHLIWAIAEPLAAYWRLFGAWVSEEKNGYHVALEFEKFITSWIGHIPLGPLFRRLSRTRASNELQELSSNFFRLEFLRHTIGNTLLREFQKDVPYDLKELLTELDFYKG